MAASRSVYEQSLGKHSVSDNKPAISSIAAQLS